MHRADEASYARREHGAIQPVVAMFVDTEDDVHARLDGTAQRVDRGGLDLPVGRQEGDPVAAGGSHARLERSADAAVGPVPPGGVREAGERGAGRVERAVPRAVVDKHDLGVRRVLPKPVHQLAQHRRDVLFFVEREDDDAERRRGHGRSRRTRAGLPATTA